MARARARVHRRRRGACGPRSRRGIVFRRRARADRRDLLGRDDHPHQGDPAQPHRPGEDAALPDRGRDADLAARGLGDRRIRADASVGPDDRGAAVAGRRRGRRQLHAVVLDADPLCGGAALGLHLHHAARRRDGRGARVRRQGDAGLRAGACARAGGAWRWSTGRAGPGPSGRFPSRCVRRPRAETFRVPRCCNRWDRSPLRPRASLARDWAAGAAGPRDASARPRPRVS